MPLPQQIELIIAKISEDGRCILVNQGINDDHIPEIIKRLRSKKISYLDLERNNIKAAAAQLTVLHVESLNLDHNQVPDDAVEALAANPVIKHLGLAYNCITDNGAKILVEKSQQETLRWHRNPINDLQLLSSLRNRKPPQNTKFNFLGDRVENNKSLLFDSKNSELQEIKKSP